ncbi:MAG: aromatic ring hydroxylase [Gemmatimonadetes bacterium]|jgi:metal-sulfur cluster biosynthetic enzyme|nr:MAG: aromatic ring hydroxylase [Gemmatimonadota bacterium]PHX96510.1 MAG: aromatic ring hydroxylase [Gemmatimonadota bacterium]
MTDDAITVGTPDGEQVSATPSPESGATTTTNLGGITPDLVKLALRRVKDPDVNLNIIDMGLIYDVRITGNDVTVDMSLTSPACPSGPEIMKDAEEQLKTLEGVGKVEINLVWSPPWGPDRIEPRVRTYLGF